MKAQRHSSAHKKIVRQSSHKNANRAALMAKNQWVTRSQLNEARETALKILDNLQHKGVESLNQRQIALAMQATVVLVHVDSHGQRPEYLRFTTVYQIQYVNEGRASYITPSRSVQNHGEEPDSHVEKVNSRGNLNFIKLPERTTRKIRWYIEHVRPLIVDGAPERLHQLLFLHTTRKVILTSSMFSDLLKSFFKKYVSGSPEPTGMSLRHVFATLLYEEWTKNEAFRQKIGCHRRNDFLEWLASHLNTSVEQLIRTYLSDVYPDLLTGNVNLFDSDEDLSSCDGLTTAACTESHQSSRESSVTTAMSSSEDLDSQEDSSSSTASNSTPLPLQNICQGNSFRSLSPEQKQLIVDEVTGLLEVFTEDEAEAMVNEIFQDLKLSTVGVKVAMVLARKELGRPPQKRARLE